MMKKKHLFFCLFLILSNSLIAAAINTKNTKIALALSDVQKKALDFSQTYKSASFEYNAALDRVNVVKSKNLPLVKLDGTYTYVTNVPKMNSVPLSDNHIYSIGPTILYSVFDSGYSKNEIKSAEAMADAKKTECNAVKNEIILKTRIAYIDAQLALDQLNLALDGLKLAEKQYLDISKRATIGSTSKQDVLASHKEVLRFSLQSKQAENNLSSKILDILTLLGEENNIDVTTPSNYSNYELDALNNTVSEIEKTVSEKTAKPHTFRIDSLKNTKKTLEYVLESIKSDSKIKIHLSERSSFEYPEQISLDRYIQNAISMNISMNLFDENKTNNLKKQKQNELNSLDEQQKNLETEMYRDYKKALNTLSSLKEQQIIAEQGALELEKFAQLTYGSYKAGQVGYLDVENANLKVLEWKVQLAGIKTRIAMQLAIIDYYLT